MIRKAKAHWEGNLKEGMGSLTTASTILKETNYSFKTRFEDGAAGTNPRNYWPQHIPDVLQWPSLQYSLKKT